MTPDLRPSIRGLLLGANMAVIVLPLVALAALRIYDVYLLRQTERQLLAESVVIGEAFRELFRQQQGRVQPDEHRPPQQRGEPYTPIEPVIDLGHRVLPAQSGPLRSAAVRDTPASRAGAALTPLLQRAQTFNLSAIRVLDDAGCVVATSRSEAGLCMDTLPEVGSALRGRYSAVARERISDEPPPPLGDVRRRGKERVFTALPIFSDGRVIGVVRGSRTGLDAVSSLWSNRRELVLWSAIIGIFCLAVSLACSAAIATPLRALMRFARATERGEPAPSMAHPRWAPREVVRLSEVLQSMAQRLRERAAYVAEFAQNASHELKNPITAIRGAAELLHQDGQDMAPAQRQRFLANMIEDSQRMERLVTGLLELARVEHAASEAKSSTDVAECARRVCARYGAAVVLESDAPLPRLNIAESHLHSVLSNLVDNAVRHGGGQPVHLRLSSRAERIHLQVSDGGGGISEANRPRLFQRFFTTERERGGTGLGLAIVKAIVDARGGEITVRTGPDGTTFSVTL
jgi:signal transduction histidine kinase